MPEPLEPLMRRLSGVAHLQDLLVAGYSRHQVARLHRTGELYRPRIGWYVASWHSTDVVQAVRVGGALGCLSAAKSYGCSVPPDQRVHVALLTHSARLRSAENGFVNVGAAGSGVVRHWAPDPPEQRFRVGLVDALAQLLGCVEPEWAIAVVDSARRRGPDSPALLSSAGFEELMARVPRERQQLLRSSSPLAESVLESIVRYRLVNAGFRVSEQVSVGRFRADLLVDETVVVECDGFEHHGGRDAFEYDRRRDATFTAAGYAVIRLSYRRVMDDWPAVLLELRATSTSRASRIRKFG